MPSNQQPVAILVTGASGFVGGHLVRALSERGYSVRALYRNTEPPAVLRALPGVEWQQCDLLDVYSVEEAMQDVDAVLHAAATVSFQPGQDEALLHNNREGTAVVVNEALVQGVRRFIHLSSVAALGRARAGAVITEEETWEDGRGNSRYAASKRAAELEVWRGAGEGLSVAMVNPGIVLGEPLHPAGWAGGSAGLMKIADREFPFYSNGVNAWVDVQDVVRALILLLESDIQNERFILSAGNFGYREVFSHMAAALGKKPPQIRATPFLTGLLWRWNAVRRLAGATPTVTRETARTAQQEVRYDNTKFLRAFPQFQYTALEQTVRRAAAAYRQDGARSL